MQKITSHVDTFKIYARFGHLGMPKWAFTCVAAGFVPPETEVEFQETKHLYPEITSIERQQAAQAAIEAAKIRAIITGDFGPLEREECAQVCEQLDPVAGARFAQAIRARGESKKKAAAGCACGAAH